MSRNVSNADMSSIASRLRSLGRRFTGVLKPSIASPIHQHSEHLHIYTAQVCPAPLHKRIPMTSRSSPLCMHSQICLMILCFMQSPGTANKAAVHVPSAHIRSVSSSFASSSAWENQDSFVSLNNIADNPGATKKVTCTPSLCYAHFEVDAQERDIDQPHWKMCHLT